MSYQRVIPRDLFNEGNLLKCLGRVYLNLEVLGRESMLTHDGEEFSIDQDENGSLIVTNVMLMRDGQEFAFRRPLNSREPWPLYLVNSDDDEISVFDESGEFTEEMTLTITLHRSHTTARPAPVSPAHASASNAT